MKMGASHTVLVSQKESSKDVAHRIIQQLGAMPEFTLETSGAQSSLQTAIHVREYSTIIIYMIVHTVACNHNSECSS